MESDWVSIQIDLIIHSTSLSIKRTQSLLFQRHISQWFTFWIFQSSILRVIDKTHKWSLSSKIDYIDGLEPMFQWIGSLKYL